MHKPFRQQLWKLCEDYFPFPFIPDTQGSPSKAADGKSNSFFVLIQSPTTATLKVLLESEAFVRSCDVQSAEPGCEVLTGCDDAAARLWNLERGGSGVQPAAVRQFLGANLFPQQVPASGF